MRIRVPATITEVSKREEMYFNTNKTGQLVRNHSGMRSGNPTIVRVDLDTDLLDAFNRTTEGDTNNQLVILQLQTNRLLTLLTKKKSKK